MASVTHHRFTVDEYEQMIEKGILTENDRIELICGEIVEKMVIGPLHSAVVNRLNRLLTIRLIDSAQISIQNPIVLGDSQPEPDVSLLLPRDDYYATSKPKASDVLLVIEVADTSLIYDREVKLPMYARGGIEELWIINLTEFKIEVYRQPLPSGAYASRTDFARGESLSIAALADIAFEVDSIVGSEKQSN